MLFNCFSFISILNVFFSNSRSVSVVFCVSLRLFIFVIALFVSFSDDIMVCVVTFMFVFSLMEFICDFAMSSLSICDRSCMSCLARILTSCLLPRFAVLFISAMSCVSWRVSCALSRSRLRCSLLMFRFVCLASCFGVCRVNKFIIFYGIKYLVLLSCI